MSAPTAQLPPARAGSRRDQPGRRGVGPLRTLLGWIRKVTIDQWRAIDRETERADGEGGGASFVVLVVMLVCCISLTLQEYVGDSRFFARLHPFRAGDKYWDLEGFAWWSGWRVLGYVVLPMIAIAIMPGQRIRDYHVSPRGFFRHLWIYAAMFAAILPVD